MANDAHKPAMLSVESQNSAAPGEQGRKRVSHAGVGAMVWTAAGGLGLTYVRP